MSEPTKVMEDLRKQTFRDFEIIIASDKGIVNAMNSALERARGEIFIRIDDDVQIPPNWLKSLLMPFSDPSVCGVTGPTLIPKNLRQNRDSIRIAEKPNWFLKWLFDNEPYALAKIYKCGSVSYGSNYEEHIRESGIFKVDHLEGTNWAMRTTLIRLVGGFDAAFDGVAEWYDTDVEQKIKKIGYSLRYNTEAIIWHMIGKGHNFSERFDVLGRIENWLRYHRRHSKFHPKMCVWFLMMLGYAMFKRIR